MKKLILFISVLLLLFGFCTTVQADPTPAVSQGAAAAPSPSPAAAFDLIKFKDYGETVVRIQLRLRELGYFNFKPTGSYQAMSVDAAIRFQQMQVGENGQSIIADGTVGEQSMNLLFTPTAKRADITASIPFGKSLNGTPENIGELLSWSAIKQLLTVGMSYRIVDFNTGVEFSMTYVGGENHAEMECPNSAESAIYKEVFGGEYNYSKRPVLIAVDDRLIAASLQGFPHGEDAVSDNEMDGHSCLFFDGSLSHVSGLPDVEHLKQIYKAAGRG